MLRLEEDQAVVANEAVPTLSQSKNIIYKYSAIDTWYQPPLHQSTKDCVTNGGLIDGSREEKLCSSNIVVLVAVGLAHWCERRDAVGDEHVEKKPIQCRCVCVFLDGHQVTTYTVKLP